MTELETQLSEAFQKLSQQYEADMKRLSDQNRGLEKQMNDLSSRLEGLTKQLQDQTQHSSNLSKSLEKLMNALTEELP